MYVLGIVASLAALGGSVALAFSGAETVRVLEVLTWFPGQETPTGMKAIRPTVFGAAAWAIGTCVGTLGCWLRQGKTAFSAAAKMIILGSAGFHLVGGVLIAASAASAVSALEVIAASEAPPKAAELTEASRQSAQSARSGFGSIALGALLLLTASLLPGRPSQNGRRPLLAGLAWTVVAIASGVVISASALVWHRGATLMDLISGGDWPRPSDLARNVSDILLALLVLGAACVVHALSQAVLGLTASSRTD